MAELSNSLLITTTMDFKSMDLHITDIYIYIDFFHLNWWYLVDVPLAHTLYHIIPTFKDVKAVICIEKKKYIGKKRDLFITLKRKMKHRQHVSHFPSLIVHVSAMISLTYRKWLLIDFTCDTPTSFKSNGKLLIQKAV